MPPLNELAKTVDVLDGQLSVSFMPYMTIRSRLLMADLDGEVKDWPAIKAGYWAVRSCLLDLVRSADAPDYRAQSLLYWWSHCTGDAEADFLLYQTVVENDASDALITAYNETRAELPKAPEILHEGRPDPETDPKGSRSGTRRSRKSSR